MYMSEKAEQTEPEKHKYHESTIAKARKVNELVKEHYEEGNQSRSKSWVYKRHVKEAVPCSFKHFWVLLKIARELNL